MSRATSWVPRWGSSVRRRSSRTRRRPPPLQHPARPARRRSRGPGPPPGGRPTPAPQRQRCRRSHPPRIPADQVESIGQGVADRIERQELESRPARTAGVEQQRADGFARRRDPTQRKFDRRAVGVVPVQRHLEVRAAPVTGQLAAGPAKWFRDPVGGESRVVGICGGGCRSGAGAGGRAPPGPTQRSPGHRCTRATARSLHTPRTPRPDGPPGSGSSPRRGWSPAVAHS